MWPDPQETADLVTLLNKPLMENFIFCAVKQLIEGYNEGLFLLLSCVDLDYNFK